MIKISVVMPVYNNEKYFPKAVESVISQDYDDYELIIVDDGSTDNTSQIADEFQRNNSHIRVIHQENQWIYNSMNNGIAEAGGEYIYILNSDDTLVEGALKLLDKKIEEYHPDIIWTKVLMHRCDEEQNILIHNYKDYARNVKEEFFSNKHDVEKAWPYFISNNLTTDQANLYKREIMQKYRFRNDVYMADTLYNITIADEINSAFILEEPIYNHFIYGIDKMNASKGKYYGYEHDMLNEIYMGNCNLFQKWNLPSESYRNLLKKMRMRGISSEIRILQAGNCTLTTEEKLYKIFNQYTDAVVREIALVNNCQEELESRILSGVRELLIKEPISSDSKMYFVYELLDSLLRYEKDEEDYKKIENAINHPLNPAHIGRTFYEKLVK